MLQIYEDIDHMAVVHEFQHYKNYGTTHQVKQVLLEPKKIKLY